MKTKILVLLLLLNPLLLWGQKLEKGVEHYKNQKYKKAIRIFSKYAKKGTTVEKLIANFYLAKIYADASQPTYSPTEANKYAAQAEEIYKKIKNWRLKRYLEKKYRINSLTIVRLKEPIAEKKFYQVLRSQDITAMKDFTYQYRYTRWADSMKYIIDSIEFYKAKFINTTDEWISYLTSNDRIEKFKNPAKKHLQTLLKAQWQQIKKNLERSQIEKFEDNYSEWFTPDSLKYYKDLALQLNMIALFRPLEDKQIPTYIRLMKQTAPRHIAYLLLTKLIEPAINQQNWQAAIDTVKKYKPLFKNNKNVDSLLAILQRPEKKLTIVRLPNTINTSTGDECFALLTADNQTLYFCGKNRDDNLGGEDIYISQRSNHTWDTAQVVTDLSTLFNHEAPLSITPDGNSMIIFKNGNLYITHKTKDGWSEPEAIEEINSKYWDADAFITADGNAIIFASDRPNPSGEYHSFNSIYMGTLSGNTDLWVVVKQGDHWSKPINLGQVINTPFAERSPFLHPDMKTLYFISNGHTTLGGTDILMSKRLSDTSWTQWSEPINLGKLINNPYNSLGFFITADGNWAYFAKETPENNMDIYKFKLPKRIKPQLVVTIFGYVTDNQGNPLSAKIIWEDLEKNQKLGQLQTDPKNGYYIITLPIGKNYGFYVSAENYYPLSENIDLRQTPKSTRLQKDFKLVPIQELIQKQTAITLKNIFFEFNSAKLKPESYPELDRLAQFIKQHPELIIEISGHTDNIGSTEYNQKLSERRAQAVKNYLVSKGCDPNQLKTVGYGSTKPIADNSTEQGRQQNRRVEFKIIGKKQN